MNIKKRTVDVRIIESNKPSETDAEAQALASVLTISGITAHRYYPQTQADLTDTVQRIAAHPRCIPYHRHFLPFLHFALHASRAGVFLGGTNLIKWCELLTLLSPLRERRDRKTEPWIPQRLQPVPLDLSSKFLRLFFEQFSKARRGYESLEILLAGSILLALH